jgi:hypothetical protein
MCGGQQAMVVSKAPHLLQANRQALGTWTGLIFMLLSIDAVA